MMKMPPTKDVEVLDEALWKFVTSLQNGHFFGVAELHFQDGQLMRVKKQEVFLPKDLNRLAAE